MTDHVDAPPELMPLEPCDCCGVPVSYRRGSLWHGRHRVCLACFYAWYDYADDPTNPESVKEARLKRFGTEDLQPEDEHWPF